MDPLQRVANRIVAGWLARQGFADIETAGGLESLTGRAVDVSYVSRGARTRVKVKPDPYCGTDIAKISDRSLPFYRPDAQSMAIETIANSVTREPGWIFESRANDLYYYYLAIAQGADEVSALASEPDDVLFSELAVERDELLIVPMPALRTWFMQHQEDYTARPVSAGMVSSWYRLVPRDDVTSGVQGIKRMGGVFRNLSS